MQALFLGRCARTGGARWGGGPRFADRRPLPDNVDVDLSALIESYGYALVALGCLLEGETLLVLAGFAAHRGHLDLPMVIAIAAVAGFLGDQFFYWLGRRHAPAVLARWPSIERKSARVHALIERYHAPVIVGVRFAYGLRIAGPVIIGTSSIPPGRFAAFNAIGALIWAVAVASVGWFFGHAAEAILGEMHRYEALLLVALVALSLVAWWVARQR